MQYAERLSKYYAREKSRKQKKDAGQFFTPSPIANFMASLADSKKEHIKILEPGSGIGILSVALIENLRKTNRNLKIIELTLYENDASLLPYLSKVIEITKDRLKKDNITLNYEIKTEDFVSANVTYITSNLMPFVEGTARGHYDLIISNPPYYKMNKKDIERYKIGDNIPGQPNIYSLFMAVSAGMLNENGQMIFITPRSFCSGLYYSQFRTWLSRKINFSHIHVFEERNNVFSKDGVLQENIITHFTKQKPSRICISTSEGKELTLIKKIYVSEKDVIYKSNGHIFFRLPTDKNELEIIRELDKLPKNFYKLGYKISTGKVVAFRNKKHLRKDISKKNVPLIWMHNIKNMRVSWPIEKKQKAKAIEKNNETEHLLIKSGNYVILKRFTTKEQKKRFDTGLISSDDFNKYQYFALDNMLNYIYDQSNGMTKEQTFGIAQYLNLPIVDKYFRILNGHTQVNANEVYALPFPDSEKLAEIGALLKDKAVLTSKEQKDLMQLIGITQSKIEALE